MMSTRETHSNRSTRHSLRLVALLLAILTLVPACSDLAANSPLSNARKTPEALAEAALAAVVAEDVETLNQLLVTRDEYETLLWPSLPDGAYVSFDFVWGMSAPRSRKGRREVMNEYAGLPLELVSVELGEETEAYETFVLYKEARMLVRRTDTGEEGYVPLMDVLVEMGGGWKFVNFGEDL
jgi:hypothetical protein